MTARTRRPFSRFAMRFPEPKRVRHAEEIIAEIVAKTLVEHVERADSAVMKIYGDCKGGSFNGVLSPIGVRPPRQVGAASPVTRCTVHFSRHIWTAQLARRSSRRTQAQPLARLAS